MAEPTRATTADTEPGTDRTPPTPADGAEDADADARYHAARAACYGAAAAAFLYPEAGRIEELTDDEAAAGLRDAADRLDLREEADALLGALEGADPDDLGRTYTRLFGLPGEGGAYPVVPYEAAHTVAGDVGQKQRRIATVVGLYEAFGLEPGEAFDERPDHVAAELELAQVLAGQRAVAVHEADSEAARRVEDAEATVLSEHLADFVPSLAHQVRRETEEAVYVAAASFAERLVERDRGGRETGNGRGTTDAREVSDDG